MIDVRVRTGKAPIAWIPIESGLHVLVHLALQIDAQLPVRADHHIGANALVRRHIAVRVFKLEVGWIVADVLFDQDQSGIGEALVEILRGCRGSEAGEEQEMMGFHSCGSTCDRGWMLWAGSCQGAAAVPSPHSQSLACGLSTFAAYADPGGCARGFLSSTG